MLIIIDEYTKGLDDDVKIFSKDPKRRQAIMTVQDDIDFLNFLHKKEMEAIIADKDAEIADYSFFLFLLLAGGILQVSLYLATVRLDIVIFCFCR